MVVLQLENRISYTNRTDEENKKNLKSHYNPHFYDKGVYYLQTCQIFECDPNCDFCVFDPEKESKVGIGGSIFLDRSNLTEIRLDLSFQSILRLEVQSEIRAENFSVAPVVNIDSFASLLVSSG